MSDEFMIHVGMGSHARLVSEWAHYKSWAETSADEVESLRRQLAAIRRGLQQLIGAPDVPQLSDAELMIALGHALEKVDGDAPVERQVVGYGKPGGAPSLVVSMPVRPGYDGPADPWEVRPPGESPWPAPPQDAERPRPDHVDDQITYAKMLERGEVDETAFPEAGDSGPPTETMQAVEEPPAVPDGYVLGRVFTRDTVDGIDWGNVLMPSDLVSRLGDWWEFVDWPDGQPGLNAVFTCNALKVNHMLREVLHVHGTVWEVVRPDAAGEQVSGE